MLYNLIERSMLQLTRLFKFGGASLNIDVFQIFSEDKHVRHKFA